MCGRKLAGNSIEDVQLLTGKTNPYLEVPNYPATHASGFHWAFCWLIQTGVSPGFRLSSKHCRQSFKRKSFDGSSLLNLLRGPCIKAGFFLTHMAEDRRLSWSRQQIQLAAWPSKTQAKAQPPRSLREVYQNWTPSRRTNTFWVRKMNTLNKDNCVAIFLKALKTALAIMIAKQHHRRKPLNPTYLAVRLLLCLEGNS